MKLWIQQKGHKGQEVKRLQKSLGVLADGTFGSKTEEALKDYQDAHGLTVDGRSGPQVRAAFGIEIYAGIDVSKWQGNIDWKTLAATGLANFCWAKVTEGNNYQDPEHKQNITGARSAGIPVGGYHFARPDLHDDPHQEVKNFVKHCPLSPGDLRPVLDFERAGDHSPDSIRNWVLTFLQEVEAQSCVRPIIYTGGNMTKYYLKSDTTGVDDYTLWHAYYSKKALKKGIKVDRLGSWPEWRVWQWTGSGTLDGISGDVDRNWLVGGQAGFDKIVIN
ncbi:hypothetical protein CMO96_04345 [Candidatus Woesebacteria bacterium]|nr:hypothetical protein [Candidatus Woesebacteria bacterium]